MELLLRLAIDQLVTLDRYYFYHRFVRAVGVQKHLAVDSLADLTAVIDVPRIEMKYRHAKIIRKLRMRIENLDLVCLRVGEGDVERQVSGLLAAFENNVPRRSDEIVLGFDQSVPSNG